MPIPSRFHWRPTRRILKQLCSPWGAALLGAALLLPPAAQAAPQPSTVATIDLNNYGDAKCNNGAAAVYHFKLSQHDGSGEVDYRKKWLVVLSGGGKCNSKETCLARWRESNRSGPHGRRLDQDDGPGDHFNMVADDPSLPGRDFDGRGILDFDGEPAPNGGTVVGETANPFRGPTGAQDGFNRVWVKYCSSDTWQGLGTSVVVRPELFRAQPFDPANGALSSLYFGGAKIVDAVIGTILAGQVPGSGAAYIPNAVHGEIVLAGSSAGGTGTIRNLDSVNAQVQASVPGVKVYGIADAMSGVGILPDNLPVATGGSPEDNAVFYTNGQIGSVRTDLGCDALQSHCHATGTTVVRDHISTPYMVVQQSYDFVIHGPMKALLTAAIQRASTLAVTIPVLQRMLNAANGNPAVVAEAYIRHAVTAGAPQIGQLLNNPAALYVPNFEESWHQLMADSRPFFVNPSQPVPMWVDSKGRPYPGPPRLGPVYSGSTVSLAKVVGNFRRCVLGDYGPSANYVDCIQTINTGLGNVGGNARVINSTALR